MAKLRKMLGKADDPVIVSLMRLIETQSKYTLADWSRCYAFSHFLPVYEGYFPEDQRPRMALDAVSEHLNGNLKLPEVKKLIKDTTNAAKEAESSPAAQAAARAISVAASVIYSPTGALGMTFYGAAAIAYHKIGISETADVYDKAAEGILNDMLVSLQSVSIPNEPNPVKINWNC